MVGEDDSPATGTVGMRFRLYDVATGGSPVWQSDACEVTLAAGGLYGVVLGAGGCDGTPALSQEHLPLGPARWLEVSIDGAVMLPRLAMAAAPTAHIAADSQRIAGQTLADLDTRYARLGADGGVALSGPLVAPSVSGDGSALTNLQPSKLAQHGAQEGQALLWNGDEWQPSTLLPSQMAQGGAATGQVLEWDGTRWAPSTPAPHKLASDGAQPGQTLKWDGRKWAPAEDIDTSNPGTVTHVSASGPLSVANGTTTPAISITRASNTRDGYLSAADWMRFDAKVSSDDPRLSNARTPTGAAGGDLAGNYPTPTVARIQGRPVSPSVPGIGQVLKWSGGQWAPRDDADSTGGVWSVNAIPPLSVSGTQSVTVSLPRASRNVAGYLSAQDFARFDQASSLRPFNGLQGFSESASWTVPEGVDRAYVRAWGGGGGGASSVTMQDSGSLCGGGGGGGAYAESLMITTPGETLSIEVGAGGSGGQNFLIVPYSPGAEGGASSVKRGSTVLVSAAGGAGAPTPTSSTRVPGAGGLASASSGHMKLDGLAGHGASGGLAQGGSFGGRGGSASASCGVANGGSGSPGYVVIEW